jgi:3-phosphoinositide dependent protein kinase-1
MSAQVSPTPQPQKKTPADFEFLDLLGEGSYAYVQLAEEKATGRRFAIKILDKKHIIKNNKVRGRPS